MRRDIEVLTSHDFDLLIIGGGIYGATAAWEAASRNLSVALIERGDFACATSSNSHKIIHGGIRYLQHGDIRRIRESIQELCVLMKIAPHLVHLRPFLLPLYGYGIKGPEVFRIALLLYKIIGYDIVRRIKGKKILKDGKVITREECIELFPEVKKKGLRGAGIWYDGQIYNSERLVMSFLESAYSKGACLGNYIEMTGFVEAGNSIKGIRAVDRLKNNQMEIKSKIVINSSGPWIDTVLSNFNSRPIMLQRKFFSALNIVTRQVKDQYGIAIMSRCEDDETIVKKGGRMYIIAPWHDCSLIGTSQKYYYGGPDDFKVSKAEVETFLSEINDALPSFNLKSEDVLSCHAGLIPLSHRHSSASDVKAEKKYEIIDHEKRDNLKGLISVIGVKYTTARDVSKKAVDLACNKLGFNNRTSNTHLTPIFGGDITNIKESLKKLISDKPYGLSDDICRHLFYSFGSRVDLILKMIGKRHELSRRLAKNLPVIEAEIAYSLEYGMAWTLEDIVFRRTDLASMGNPSDDVLLRVAEMAAEYHKWDTSQFNKEMDEIRKRFAVLNLSEKS